MSLKIIAELFKNAFVLLRCYLPFWQPLFPLRKFYAEQMLVLLGIKRKKPSRHTTREAFQLVKGLCDIYI